MRSSWNADRADFLITSGVCNMTSIQELFITGSVVFKYYSGEEPEFVEGDVFRLIVPLNEDYSYDIKNGDKKTAIKNGDKKISKKTIQNYKKILEFMEEGKEYTIQDFCNLLNLKPSRTKELLKALTQDIEQIGNNKNRKYRLK